MEVKKVGLDIRIHRIIKRDGYIRKLKDSPEVSNLSQLTMWNGQYQLHRRDMVNGGCMRKNRALTFYILAMKETFDTLYQAQHYLDTHLR